MSAASCPNCRAPMELIALASAVKRLEIDACFACHGFWFDAMESPGLSGQSVLDLFKLIHEHRNSMRHTVGARLECPRCQAVLVRTQDIQRTNRLEYHRCPNGCGRLTTFFQFLREKNFVRSLSPSEMKQLRVQVSQVRCSSCGAVVAVEKDAVCQHCRAPVSVLDADAVEKQLAELKSRPGPRQGAAQGPARAAPASSGREPFEWVRRNNEQDRLHGGIRDLLEEAVGGFSGWFND